MPIEWTIFSPIRFVTKKATPKRTLVIAIALLLLPPAEAALAWGATGHEFVSGVAAEILPDEIPAFVRTPRAVADIAVLGRELDRSKGSGVTHDSERDPGHSASAWLTTARWRACYPSKTCRSPAKPTTPR